MALWTDTIDPVTLTKYARKVAEFEDSADDSLAQFLPNEKIEGLWAEVPVTEEATEVDVANYRAFDTDVNYAQTGGESMRAFRLAPLGQQLKISEQDQVTYLNANKGDKLKKAMARITDTIVRNTVARVELARAQALVEGRVTIPEVGINDDFGRKPEHNTVAAQLWDDPEAPRIEYLKNLRRIYQDTNGEDPGCIYMSELAFDQMLRGKEFVTVLNGGHERAAREDEALALLASYRLPKIVIAKRTVRLGGVKRRVMPVDKLLLLPEPVDINDAEGTQLGATFWGQPLTATEGGFSLGNMELPGLVAYGRTLEDFQKNVRVDAIATPVLQNPNLSLVAKVLAD